MPPSAECSKRFVILFLWGDGPAVSDWWGISRTTSASTTSIFLLWNSLSSSMKTWNSFPVEASLPVVTDGSSPSVFEAPTETIISIISVICIKLNSK